MQHHGILYLWIHFLQLAQGYTKLAADSIKCIARDNLIGLLLLAAALEFFGRCRLTADVRQSGIVGFDLDILCEADAFIIAPRALDVGV